MKRLLFLTVVLICAGFADDKDAATAGLTRSQGEAILEELRQVRVLLEKLQPKAAAPSPPPAPAPPSRATLKLAPSLDHIGKDDAPATIVEFVDYECGYCRQFHLSAFRELRKNYIETGRVRFYSLDLPLDMHANAKKAAVAAHCAGDQGQYWSMRETLIGNGARLSPDMILEIGRSLYLDMTTFQTCVNAERYMPVVEGAMQQASTLSITGTPTFIIGKTTKEGVEGALLVGAMPYANFESELKKLEVDQ